MFGPRLPRNALDAYAVSDARVTHALWAYLANRGVWEALIGAGPTCSIATTEEDVQRYVDAYAGFLDELS